MPWPTDPAVAAVFEALLLFRETHGPEKLKDLLAQELGRETVIARIAAARKTEAGMAETEGDARSSLSEEDEAELFGALEFYADPENYARRGSKPSSITVDRGKRARKVLDSLGAEGRE